MFENVAAHANLAAALSAYKEARFDDALVLLNASGEGSVAQQLLRARVLLRTGQAMDAVRGLLRLEPEPASVQDAERKVLLGAAYGHVHDYDAALRSLHEALSLPTPPAVHADAVYYTALIHWLRFDNMAAEEALEPLIASADHNECARAYILLAWIAIRRHDLQSHIDCLGRALDHLEEAGADRNPYYLARTLNTLSAVCREMVLPDVASRVRKLSETISWTSGLQLDRFHVLRSLAWMDALDGNHIAAFQQLKAASVIAPSDAARVLSLADRAYLARCTGEQAFFSDQLADAHASAQKVRWEETQGEDRAALVVLAQLFAPFDAAEAIAYLSHFRTLQSNALQSRTYGADARVRAFAAYSEAVARQHLGENAHAETLLREAFGTFEEFSYVWRAARCAYHLFELTHDHKWLDIASRRIQAYPRSWIAARINRANSPGFDAASRLTPSQQQVFELLCQGASTNDIAKRLQRSPFTIRNHISDIFEALGVHSRSELLAMLPRSRA